MLCGLLLTGCVIYRSAQKNVGGAISREDNPVKWYPTTLRQFLTCVSICELTFSCHFNILPMHTELRHQTRKNKRIILFSAMGITFLMNATVSFFGYFLVGPPANFNLIQGLYGQGKSGGSALFTWVWESQGMSGKVRETCNGRRKIALL